MLSLNFSEIDKSDISLEQWKGKDEIWTDLLQNLYTPRRSSMVHTSKPYLTLEILLKSRTHQRNLSTTRITVRRKRVLGIDFRILFCPHPIISIYGP